MEIAKDTFEENAEIFNFPDSDEDRASKIQNLQDRFDLLIDAIEVIKKPNYSEDQLEGVHEGLERSKELFGGFINEYI